MLSIKSIYQLSYVNKILALSKLKVFADDNFNAIQMVRFFFGRVENILGKGENAGYQHFSLFLQCFNPFPKQTLVFTCLQYKSFKNTVGKGEIAYNQQFLLFPQCFLPL